MSIAAAERATIPNTTRTRMPDDQTITFLRGRPRGRKKIMSPSGHIKTYDQML